MEDRNVPTDNMNHNPVEASTEVVTEQKTVSTDPFSETNESSSQQSWTENSVEPAVVTPVNPETKPHRKFDKKLMLLILAFVLAAAFLGWWYLIRSEKATAPTTNQTQTDAAPRLGVAVGIVEGTVEFSKDGNSWLPLTLETELSESDSVKTTAGARLVLLIDDGSAVRLSESSEVQLTSLAADDVRVDNKSGEVYARVVASQTRKFGVYVAGDLYEAKGTAFRTTSKDDKKGVEVYHSGVKVNKSGEADATKNPDVEAGNAYFKTNTVKEKENVVTAIDLEELKKDAFLKWNSEQDKSTAEFADKLGVLGEFYKPAPATPKTVTPVAGSSITLSGSVSEYSAKFSWKVNGVDTSQGYKLVKSKSTKTPVYPGDNAAYIEAGKSSYSLFLGDGKTYYFRICAYRGDSCVSYSNAVTITTPVKEVEPVVSGAVTLSLAGNVANWTFAGTAPHGFKLVLSQAPDTPSYGNANKTFYTGSPYTIEGLDSGTYNVRVCKYTASDVSGGCTDYSNQVQLVVP
ncbi:MAG: FecR family protein [bacterium]|nr:FecR family protein [bacterium]